MQVRRCAVLWLEPRETASFELDALLAGGTGVVSAMRWFAHAPQLPTPVVVEAEDAALLGSLSPTDWVAAASLHERHSAGRVRALLRAGLLIGRGKAWAMQREADQRFRDQHWHGLASAWHTASRWQGLDAAREVADDGMDTADGLRGRYGAPPPELQARVEPSRRLSLPVADETPFDELLDARSTCRNFDASGSLSREALACVLARTFGVRGGVHAAADFDVLKKTSPSGGALHPTEAYLIVQRVEGIAPGLYHYHAGDHALEPIAFPAVKVPSHAKRGRVGVEVSDSTLDAGRLAPPSQPSPAGGGRGNDLAAFARLAVAGQYWFADAPVLVVLAPRFARNFWKYRNHAKAYRVVILDIGHLSQTLYLSATELGLGAFITAAINEVDIEQAFGLTGYVDGPLAVCGFGVRADTMVTSEFDPNRKVWPRRG